jgi:hypothetical protein
MPDTPAADSAPAALPLTPVTAPKKFRSKRKGARNEARCRRALEAAGYLVTKAGGSLGLFDLIALGPRDVRAIQVKSGTNRLSPLEREAIKELTLAPCVSREYWLYLDRVREPRIEHL